MSTLRLGLTALAFSAMVGAAVAQTTAPGATPSTTPETRPAETKAEQKPPLAGANSFTEAQARDRISKAGFEDVKELKKDDQGVWRGQASKSGQQVGVALDYRGNVVQQ